MCKLVKEMFFILLLMWGMSVVTIIGIEREMEQRESAAAARVALEVRR